MEDMYESPHLNNMPIRGVGVLESASQAPSVSGNGPFTLTRTRAVTLRGKAKTEKISLVSRQHSAASDDDFFPCYRSLTRELIVGNLTPFADMHRSFRASP